MLKQLLNRNNLINEKISNKSFERKGQITNNQTFTLKTNEIQTNVTCHSIIGNNEEQNNLNQILEKQYLVKDIYVINLENQIEKKLLMKKKLSSIGLTVNFIEGINGFESREYNSFLKINPQLKSLGAVGLLKTYLKILESLSEEELEKNPFQKILIFEDDICFHKDFVKIIKKHHLKNYDIINLGINYTNLDSELLDKMNYQEIVYYNKNNIKKHHLIYGTYGIIYSYRYLLLLKKYLKTEQFNFPVDILYNKIIVKDNLKGVFFNPALVVPIVSYSTNMGFRNQEAFMRKINQNPKNYSYYNLSLNFNDLYLNYLLGKTSRENIINQDNFDLLGKELINIFENGNKYFVFIITSFNNQDWVIKNLDSVRNQNYPFWRIIYYDDNSSDKTVNLVKEYINKYQLNNRFILIENNIRNYQGYGRWISFQHCYDDEICILLDGDDWLYNHQVLKNLNQLYLDNDILVSYGGMIYWLNDKSYKTVKSKSFPQEIINNNDYQHYQWISNHLRTGYAKLFKSIPLNYLKMDGEYIKCCTDWAEMFWVLNKSKGKHLPNNFIGCVYNKKASLGYDNSYYNQDKDIKWKEYRIKVENKYKTYNYNE